MITYNKGEEMRDTNIIHVSHKNPDSFILDVNKILSSGRGRVLEVAISPCDSQYEAFIVMSEK